MCIRSLHVSIILDCIDAIHNSLHQLLKYGIYPCQEGYIRPVLFCLSEAKEVPRAKPEVFLRLH